MMIDTKKVLSNPLVHIFVCDDTQKWHPKEAADARD
ncbi:MAG: hypothetical protein JWQ72_1940 [Polaromonas sp.]|nr:hypothetical protein [Polaromonas sp.]